MPPHILVGILFQYARYTLHTAKTASDILLFI